MKRTSDKIQPAITDISDSIPTYVINLKKRTDRKEYVIEQFAGKDEFRLQIVQAFEHSFGALGLWATIRYILMDLAPPGAEYIIICEDDIEFTEHYSKENLIEFISQAQKLDADILLGGVSWADDAVQISESIFWTNNFSGLQFTIIFKDFISTLKQTRLINYDAADYFIARLSDNIFVRHPFLAIQKDFGYSDATAKNNTEGKVHSLFRYSDSSFFRLSRIKNLYKELPKDEREDLDNLAYNTITIPTYVINLTERTERLAHIKAEFEGKPEFDVQIVEACKHEVGALGLWMSIRKIIKMAIANEDDVIVICEDDHQFTKDYTKEFLIRNIIEANEEGAYLLSGGTGKFNQAIPITLNRYWVGHLLSTQFVVIYKDFFQYILDEPFDEKIVADLAYSRMTPHKMLLYPFISTQKDFGYSDITNIHNEQKSLVTDMFLQSNYKLKRIQQAYIKYHPETIITKQTIQ
ncbi:hypothetical protein ACFS5N_13515 [Mucilaginibacter ximonensis]|uniref:Glycosyl transferase family 25 n=1 Tax=Mucilaginibacter ximonensis TaxID=538021 RepID=A0ABW5YF77_9SPHI